MNHTARNLIRVAGVVAGLGAAVWALRDRLLPAPEVHSEPPPRFRTVETSTEVPNESKADDLTTIKGIGPVTATKLAANDIHSFKAITNMTPESLAHAAGTSSEVAGAWIESAAALV
ncbi:MAG: helix-hairpin-helix domain-containing protein [Acidimicrobiia bacterium]